MWNRQTVVEKVSNTADRYGAVNPQQLEQLLFNCKEVPDTELFFGLFSFFYDPALQENSFNRQKLAGKILYELCPSCPLKLEGAIYAIPSHWNLSVEEVSWYFCKIFGKGTVLQFLEELMPEVASAELKKSLETMLFLAKNFNQENT